MENLSGKKILWLVLGLLLYAVGGVAFVVVVISSPVLSSGSADGPSTGVLLAALLACTALFALGGYFMWKGRPTSERGESVELPSQFVSGQMYVDESASAEWNESFEPDPGASIVVCPECGAKNEAEYMVCGNCASKLAE